MLFNRALRHVFSLALIVAPLVALLFVTTARAAEIKPLRSADLDARLSAAGFDDAQRAKILVDYDAYVRQFTTVAVPLIKQWAGTPSSSASTVEEARALQSKGRAAAQAIDDAERPLLDAIRNTARPDQADATRRLIAMLEIRRDLAFAQTASEWTFGTQSFDLIDAVDAIESRAVAPEKIASLKPQLDQYLIERQALVRKLRDATINMPLRRAEAMEKSAQQPSFVDPTPGDAAANQEQLQARIAARFADMKALRDSAMMERNAARVKLGELDIRTIDAILPTLSGRDQGRFLDQWSRASSMMGMGIGAGPMAISVAWTTPQQQIPAGAAPQIDQICAGWVAQWWPLAKESAMKSLRNSDPFGFAFDSGPEEQSQRMIDATQVAVDALSLAMNLQGAGTASDDRAAGAVRQSARVETVTVQGASDGPMDEGGSTVTISVSSVGSDESGDPIELMEGMEVSGFEMLDLSDMEGMDGMVGGMTVMLGDAMDAQISFDGAEMFKKPSAFPALIDFPEIKPVFLAAGSDEVMLAVAQIAIDDLNADVRTLIDSSRAHDAVHGDAFGEMFEMKPDGSVGMFSPEVRVRRAAEREALRTQVLALETSSLDALLPAVVPSAGKPVVDWLAPWRSLESARAAASVGGGMFGGATSNDPVRAILRAQLSSDDWKAISADLASSCAQLAVQMRELTSVTAQANAAMPMPDFSSVTGADGNVAVAQGIELSNDHAGIELAMKLQEQSAVLRKNVQQAQRQMISRLKERLKPEPAQRLQDAWDDQLYARDLKDSTDLSSRFEAARVLKLPEAIASQAVTLEASWRSQSRAIRNLIVAAREKVADKPDANMAQGMASRKERAAVMTALKFEREEMNRKVFRELCAVLGADFSSQLQPLPQSKRAAKRGAGGGGVVVPVPAADGIGSTPAPVPAPAPTPTQSR